MEDHVPILLAELSGVYGAHLALLLQVHFVANHQEGEIIHVRRGRLGQEDLLPVEQVVETLWVGHIVAQTAAVSSSVER